MVWCGSLRPLCEIGIADAAANQAHTTANRFWKTRITQCFKLAKYFSYCFFYLIPLLQTWVPWQVSIAFQQLTAHRDFRWQ